jgi:hypothetical protein
MRPIRRWMVLVCLGIAANAFGIDLVRDGKPVATVVVAPGAARAIRFAAEELQAIVEKVSGARLAIATEVPAGAGGLVLLGTDAANLAGKDVLAAANLGEVSDDGYAVTAMPQRKPPCLTIVSKEPRGTLFATYDLLERFVGCGFFNDGDFLPKKRDVVIMDTTVVGNPAHADRLCYVETRFYGPKRFQAALWNVNDWKSFLRWMAKRKMNCLAVDFTADSRSWGEAFDRAFPETKRVKAETVTPRGAIQGAGVTSRMGWGLNPTVLTNVMKEALTYAREQLGLKTLYVFSYGQFEESLQQVNPDLAWLAPSPDSVVGTAGQSAWLAATDAKCQEFQVRLWESVVKTYGRADYYLVFCRPDLDPTPEWASNIVGLTTKAMERVDREGSLVLSTTERDLWGKTVQDRLDMLRKLPSGAAVFYLTTRAPDVSPLQPDRFNPKDHRRRAYSEIPPRSVDDSAASVVRDEVRDLPHYLPSLVIAFEYFAGRPYWYGCAWNNGPSHDLLENRFGLLTYLNLHRLFTPSRRQARGFCNWSTIRGTNPLMEQLCADFAWNGQDVWRSEGASDNRFTRAYMLSRYGLKHVSGQHPAPAALKQALRGTPMEGPDTNYRAYERWAERSEGGEAAARTAIQIALRFKEEAKDSPFYEPDLADYGRNYLHQYVCARYGEVVDLLGKAKEAAKAERYSNQDRNQNLARLEKLEASILRAHKALTRLVATRQDMSLDDAILEATKTPGANKNLEQAIREQQSGAFADGLTLVDSVEYLDQLKTRQHRFFLDNAKQELTTPSNKPILPWREIFMHGTGEYIEKSKPVPYEQKAEKAPASQILQEFLKATE